MLCWAWWHSLLTPQLPWLRQEDHKFQERQGYRVRPYLTAGKQANILQPQRDSYVEECWTAALQAALEDLRLPYGDWEH